jgi:hypothetical protein
MSDDATGLRCPHCELEVYEGHPHAEDCPERRLMLDALAIIQEHDEGEEEDQDR